jgi:hypothetical protein
VTEQTPCEASECVYSAFDLENDIYDLNRMLRAAEFLQTESGGEEEIASSARLLVEQAAKMANDLHAKFQANMWKVCSKTLPA